MNQTRWIFGCKPIRSKGILTGILALLASGCAMTVSAWFASSITCKDNVISPGYYRAELYWSEQPEGIYSPISEGIPFSPGTASFFIRVISTSDSSADFSYQLTVIPEHGSCAIKPWKTEDPLNGNQIESVCSPGQAQTYQVEQSVGQKAVTVSFSSRYSAGDPFDENS